MLEGPSEPDINESERNTTVRQESGRKGASQIEKGGEREERG